MLIDSGVEYYITLVLLLTAEISTLVLNSPVLKFLELGGRDMTCAISFPAEKEWFG